MWIPNVTKIRYKSSSENTQYLINQQYKLIYLGLQPAEILSLREILSNNTYYCNEMNICGVIVSGDDYSTGLSFDEMAYSEDPNISSACAEGDYIATNFTAGDEINCYSPCPSENIEMCGKNGCLTQLEPPICECVSDAWFPEGLGSKCDQFFNIGNINLVLLLWVIIYEPKYNNSDIFTPTKGDPNETEQHEFPTVEPCKPKVENWVVIVIPILTVILLVVGIFIYHRKRKKNYKIEEEKNDEISLNKTTDSENENPPIQPIIQEQTNQPAVQAAPIENRAYMNESDAESIESETGSSRSDQTRTSGTNKIEQNAQTQRSHSPVTETETESETESELSIRTKTKLIEKEIRKVRKDIDFLKNCDDSSVTGIL